MATGKMKGKSDRILIVTGDDFGAASVVNRAIIKAHCEGVLTCASIMVNGYAFDEAVALAKDHPQLGLGIHMTLLRAKPVLPPFHLPNLLRGSNELPEEPVLAGFMFYFNRKVKADIEKELEAQILKFLEAGLTPSYLDGHLHFHVHPAVLTILVRLAGKYRIPAFRLPRESLLPNLTLNGGNMWSKIAHAVIYRALCSHAARVLRNNGILFPDHFFGLLSCGHMTEPFLLGIIDAIEPGVTEIGTHPALSMPPELAQWTPDYEYEEELRALTSFRVKTRIEARGIQLAGYTPLIFSER